MPIIKSARKRVKTAGKASIRNAKTKRSLREALKSFYKSLEGGKAEEIAKAESAAMSAIDTAAKKAVIHKNKAARKKSQVSAAVKKHGVKKVKTAKPAKSSKPKAKNPAKTSPKKATTKKSTAKK